MAALRHSNCDLRRYNCSRRYACYKCPMLAGRIFGGFLYALFAVAAIYLYVKTARSSISKIANDSSENNEPKSE